MCIIHFSSLFCAQAVLVRAPGLIIILLDFTAKFMQQFVTFCEEGVDGALAFGYCAVFCHEFSAHSHAVDGI